MRLIVAARIKIIVVLVEVKTRCILNKHRQHHAPELAVNKAKQEKYRTLALCMSSSSGALTSIDLMLLPSICSSKYSKLEAFNWALAGMSNEPSNHLRSYTAT